MKSTALGNLPRRCSRGLLLLVMFLCPEAWGQRVVWSRAGRPETRLPLRLPLASGVVQDRIQRTRDLLAGGKLTEGAQHLRRLLALNEEGLLRAEKDRYVAPELFFRTLVESLTPEQKEAFVKLFSGLATDRLNQWKEGDRRSRDLLAREFLFTPEGRQALRAQVEERLEAGDFTGAGDRLELLLSLGGPRREVRTVALAAFVKLLSGEREEADRYLGQVAELPGGGAAQEELLQWFHRWRHGQPQGGKAPQRSALGVVAVQKAPFREGVIRWRTASVLQRAGFDSPFFSSAGSQAVPFAGRVYAIREDELFVFHGQSGKLIEGKKVPSALRPYEVDPQVERSLPGLIVTERFIVGSFIVQVEEPDSFWSFAITEPIPFRRVVVFSRGDFSLRWRSDRIRDLARVNVVGEPLLRGNVLYVPGWTKDGFINIYVCAVELSTGRVLWKRLICGGQVPTTMFGEMAVEPYGVTLNSSGRFLVVATHMGVIAALDRFDGALRWACTYDVRPQPALPRRTVILVDQREAPWEPNPIFIRGEKAYVAPQDSQNLFCVNLLSGKLLHCFTSLRSMRMPYLLGFRGDLLYRAGPDGIGTLTPDLRPRQIYRSPAALVGRPALTRDGIYFCVSGALKFFDFNGHRARTVSRWPPQMDAYNAGNVTIGSRKVYVVSRRCVSAYEGVPEEAP